MSCARPWRAWPSRCITPSRRSATAGLKVNYPLVLNEGGAKSVLWRRIITDVFDVGTVLLERRTGAPYGDAILAGVATGVFKDFSVARQWAATIEPMEPDAEAHAAYMERFALFKQVYQDLKDDFVELARSPLEPAPLTDRSHRWSS